MASHGLPPTRAECAKVEAYTPTSTFEAPGDIAERQRDLRDGTFKLYGTKLSRYAQELLAWEYGVSRMGFDDTPVTFKCQLNDQSTVTMYVSREGWFSE